MEIYNKLTMYTEQIHTHNIVHNIENIKLLVLNSWYYEIKCTNRIGCCMCNVSYKMFTQVFIQLAYYTFS